MPRWIRWVRRSRSSSGGSTATRCRQKLNEPDTLSIGDRIGTIRDGHWQTRQMPTATQRRGREIAPAGLDALERDLNALIAGGGAVDPGATGAVGGRGRAEEASGTIMSVADKRSKALEPRKLRGLSIRRLAQPLHVPHGGLPRSGTASAPAAASLPLQAVSAVLRELPDDFPAAVVVAQHLSGEGSALLGILGRRTKLPAEWASTGARLTPGRVLVCPPRCSFRLAPTPGRRLRAS
jgi:hypothetical protein